MNDLFQAIKKRLEPLKASDRIKTVDLWNNQLEAIREGKQKAIVWNAIFISFSLVPPIKHVGLGVKYKTINVRFRFALKKFRSDKSLNLDFQNNFSALIDGWASTTGQAPGFSAFREVDGEPDEDHDLIALPFVDYQTQYIDATAYRFRKKDQEYTPAEDSITIDVSKEIITN